MHHRCVSIIAPLVLVASLGACSAYSAAPVQPPSDDPTSGSEDATHTTDSNGTQPASPGASAPTPPSFRGIYITSRKSLYRFDVAERTVRKVGDYDCVGASDPDYERGAGMSDIAVDRQDRVYGIATKGTSEGLVVRIDPIDATCKEVQSVGDHALRGLATVAVPHGAEDEEALVSTFNAHYVGVKMGVGALALRGAVELRPMGFLEDLVAIPELGVLAVDHSLTTSALPRLVHIDPETGALLDVRGFIDAFRVTGLAYWDEALIGVTFDRHVIAIDPKTAAKSDLPIDVEPGDDDFSGAAAMPAERAR